MTSRPDFRDDPVFKAYLIKNNLSRPDPVPQNMYHEMLRLRPQMAQTMAQIVTEPALKAAITAGQKNAAELAFELMLLPGGIEMELSDFSATHYLLRYPDVAEAGILPLVHFIDHGLSEGRDTLRKLRRNLSEGALAFDPAKKTVLIAVHEFSTTGAPIVGLQLVREAAQDHNVVVLSIRGGGLLEQFLQSSCCVFVTENPREEVEVALGPWLKRADFALLNSAEAVAFVPMLVEQQIPFSAYIHEYAEYCLPAYKTIFLSAYADFLIYSTQSVRDTWRGIHLDVGFDTDVQSVVVPQADLAPSQISQSDHTAARARISQVLGFDLGNRKLIYCAGSAQWRKGTDLFAMTAQMAHRLDPEAVFLLIGDGLNHQDIFCGVWLEKHLQEAEVNRPGGFLYAIPGGPHYKDVCAAADIMMLASRLDPLPNVVLDAVKYDCDVVLFDKTSGFDDPQYRDMDRLHSVGFGLLDEAARVIHQLPRKSDRCPLVAPKPPAAAPQANLFHQLTSAHASRKAARRHFFLGDGHFDVPMLFSASKADAGSRALERNTAWNLQRRLVWKSQAEAARVLANSPFAVHQSSQIRRYAPAAPAEVPAFSLHLHAYYTEDLEKDLRGFLAFGRAKRIVVTTDSTNKANQIRAIGKAAGLKLEIEQVPNQGRDILPFMRLFYTGSGIGADGVWGHLHQKKSLRSSVGGDVWRRFMLAILLGDDAHLSNALAAMSDPGTGLAAPFDPYIVGWYGARRLLPNVSPRIGVPLPPHPLVFTVGNMFWTRPEVVRKMVSYFGEAYPYPNEPIADDGTVFHLIERLWPTASADCGLASVFINKPDQPRR